MEENVTNAFQKSEKMLVIFEWITTNISLTKMLIYCESLEKVKKKPNLFKFTQIQLKVNEVILKMKCEQEEAQEMQVKIIDIKWYVMDFLGDKHFLTI